MVDTHDGVRLKPGLYQDKDGSLCMCFWELMQQPEFKGKPLKCLHHLYSWVKSALQKGYQYMGGADPWHLYFCKPRKLVKV